MLLYSLLNINYRYRYLHYFSTLIILVKFNSKMYFIIIAWVFDEVRLLARIRCGNG